MKCRYKVITYRNPDDYIFGSWKYIHTGDGGALVMGILKKSKTLSLFQKIYRSG